MKARYPNPERNDRVAQSAPQRARAVARPSRRGDHRARALVGTRMDRTSFITKSLSTIAPRRTGSITEAGSRAIACGTRPIAGVGSRLSGLGSVRFDGNGPISESVVVAIEGLQFERGVGPRSAGPAGLCQPTSRRRHAPRRACSASASPFAMPRTATPLAGITRPGYKETHHEARRPRFPLRPSPRGFSLCCPRTNKRSSRALARSVPPCHRKDALAARSFTAAPV
jgi:hypothetical protein